jgi:hypothetical protein
MKRPTTAPIESEPVTPMEAFKFMTKTLSINSEFQTSLKKYLSALILKLPKTSNSSNKKALPTSSAFRHPKIMFLTTYLPVSLRKCVSRLELTIMKVTFKIRIQEIS